MRNIWPRGDMEQLHYTSHAALAQTRECVFSYAYLTDLLAS